MPLSWFYFSIEENFFFCPPLNSWSLLHLAMVKLVLHNVKNFFPIAGVEFSGKFGIWKINVNKYNKLPSSFLYKIHVKGHLVLKKIYCIGDLRGLVYFRLQSMVLMHSKNLYRPEGWRKKQKLDIFSTHFRELTFCFFESIKNPSDTRLTFSEVTAIKLDFINMGMMIYIFYQNKITYSTTF